MPERSSVTRRTDEEIKSSKKVPLEQQVEAQQRRGRSNFISSTSANKHSEHFLF